MSWAIVADSSCNLRSLTEAHDKIIYKSVPLTIHVGGVDYVDDDTLDVHALNEHIAAESEASSSSCPSAGLWAEAFRAADNVIAICISSNLSGSFEAANMARNIVLDEYAREHDGVISGKNIFVLNSRAAGGKLELLVTLLNRYLTENNPTFEQAVSYIEGVEERSQVLYSLSSYENLMKNGRMPRLAGTIASKLNIRVLGTASIEGTIKIVGPARGEKKMAKKIISVMENDGYTGGMVYIDHVENEPAAEQLKQTILERWPEAEVFILPCGALCSYYAEREGLIIGYTWA